LFVCNVIYLIFHSTKTRGFIWRIPVIDLHRHFQQYFVAAILIYRRNRSIQWEIRVSRGKCRIQWKIGAFFENLNQIGKSEYPMQTEVLRKTGLSRRNRSSYWKTLSYNFVSSTPQTHNVRDNRIWL
jgi:hypothetical protein